MNRGSHVGQTCEIKTDFKEKCTTSSVIAISLTPNVCAHSMDVGEMCQFHPLYSPKCVLRTILINKHTVLDGFTCMSENSSVKTVSSRLDDHIMKDYAHLHFLMIFLTQNEARMPQNVLYGYKNGKSEFHFLHHPVLRRTEMLFFSR